LRADREERGTVMEEDFEAADNKLNNKKVMSSGRSIFNAKKFYEILVSSENISNKL